MNMNMNMNMSLAAQAHRVREYDIIITTHGSHSVSLAFIKPCTVVLELLHDSYLVPMFGQLAGGRSFFLQLWRLSGGERRAHAAECGPQCASCQLSRAK